MSEIKIHKDERINYANLRQEVITTQPDILLDDYKAKVRDKNGYITFLQATFKEYHNELFEDDKDTRRFPLVPTSTHQAETTTVSTLPDSTMPLVITTTALTEPSATPESIEKKQLSDLTGAFLSSVHNVPTVNLNEVIDEHPFIIKSSEPIFPSAVPPTENNVVETTSTTTTTVTLSTTTTTDFTTSTTTIVAEIVTDPPKESLNEFPKKDSGDPEQVTVLRLNPYQFNDKLQAPQTEKVDISEDGDNKAFIPQSLGYKRTRETFQV